jgi:HKD family nuclease
VRESSRRVRFYRKSYVVFFEYNTVRISLYVSVQFASVDTVTGYEWNVCVSTHANLRLTFRIRSSFSVINSSFFWCRI